MCIRDRYISNVNFNLTAYDNESGLAEIMYKINNGIWQLYNGTIEFTNDGEYTIQFYAKDNVENNNSNSILIKIDRVPPTSRCDFSGKYSNGKYTTDVTITFTASDAKSGVQSIKYRIDEGNWLTVDGTTAQHVVSQEGDHVVEYYAIDKAGNTAGVAQKTFKILKNKPPTANFDYSPYEPTDLETIQFADQSTDPDGEIVSWEWDFGDGNTSTQQNPSHRYADNGTYIVKLTVTDDKGASAFKQIIIEVLNDPPTSAFTTDPEKPKINEEVCNFCGKCAKYCEFNALIVLPGKVLVFEELCKGCGLCKLVCPTNAISEEQRELGIVEEGKDVLLKT